MNLETVLLAMKLRSHRVSGICGGIGSGMGLGILLEHFHVPHWIIWLLWVLVLMAGVITSPSEKEAAQ